MKIAIIGCGFVADFYVNNIRSHPDFDIKGVFDLNSDRLDQFCRYYSLNAYPALETILEDPDIEMVLNLTSVSSHFDVSSDAINAKKHVYSEKPLASDLNQAQTLLDLAKQKDVRIGCAPCGVLSDTAQTIWKAIRDGAIGKVRLIYGSWDAGFIEPSRFRPWLSRSESGAFWPGKDEFEVGCTYEHAGYLLTWLAAFFGPARKVTAFSSCQIPDKGIKVDVITPDFSVGCIEYDEGIVARITNGLAAPQDKSLTVIGNEGVLFVRNIRGSDREPVFISKPTRSAKRQFTLKRLQEKLLVTASHILFPANHNYLVCNKYPMVKGRVFNSAGPRCHCDYFRGPQDMLDSIRLDQPHRLSAELGLHIFEIIEALQYPERFNYQRVIESQFPAIQPLF